MTFELITNVILGRICPGKRVADTSLFLAITMLVSVFNISKVKDSTGYETDPDVQYTAGVIRYLFVGCGDKILSAILP